MAAVLLNPVLADRTRVEFPPPPRHRTDGLINKEYSGYSDETKGYPEHTTILARKQWRPFTVIPPPPFLSSP
jgi:hypothetical protein